MNETEKILYVFALITSTQSTRLLPLLMESKLGNLIKSEETRRKLNEAVFILLICYCFKDISATKEYGIRIASALIVMVLQYRFEKTLISIFTGTFIYMVSRNIL
jgi:branched-subunit amino acid transport protein AzlD